MSNGPQRVLPLAEGRGWRVRQVICTAGPSDPAAEECHDTFSIAAVIAGTFTYRSTQGTAFLAPGSLLLGNMGACFECGHEHGVGDRCIAFHYSEDLFEEIVAGIPGATRLEFPLHRIPPRGDLVPLVESARRSAARKDAGEIEELALSLAARAVAASRTLNDDAIDASRRRDIRRVTEAVRYIERHYAEAISLESLAARTGLGRFHFLRVFRATVGTTPYQYLVRMRLAAAARALRKERQGVLDAALSAGFGDLSEFTRRFRRVFGTTPSAWARSGA